MLILSSFLVKAIFLELAKFMRVPKFVRAFSLFMIVMRDQVTTKHFDHIISKLMMMSSMIHHYIFVETGKNTTRVNPCNFIDG